MARSRKTFGLFQDLEIGVIVSAGQDDSNWQTLGLDKKWASF